MIAVILAGGEGKRLRPLTADRPKPMVYIGGKPVLEHQLVALQKYGIKEVYILTGYKGETIEAYFRDASNFGIRMTCVKESSSMGTVGAVKQLEGIVISDFLLIYGDVLFDMKLDDFVAFHKKKNGAATLVVHPSDHPYDSDLVEVDDESAIKVIFKKPHGEKYYRNLGNAAIYILSPKVFDYIPDGSKSEFMKDVFPKMLAGSEKLYAYKTAEYIKDMGTPDRLRKVETDLLSGRISRFSKESVRPAVFIDRDGTLIKEVDLLHKVEDLELFSFSRSAIRNLNQSDYISVLLTNQSVIARNLCDKTTIDNIHKKLETQLGKDGAYLTDIFYCPHHPDKGFPEENTEYKIACDCRKPETGMIDKAVAQYNIDINSSWIIGDSTTDIQTGLNAGIKKILVRTGKGGRDKLYQANPDFVFNDVKEAVEFITEKKSVLDQAAMKVVKLLDLNSRPAVIIIGGPSRSGKSTFVRCLLGCLKLHNISAEALTMDNWLKGKSQRSDSMTVQERYQYENVVRDVKELIRGGPIRTRVYDQYSREVSDGRSLELKNCDCLIIEGVPALDIEDFRKLSHIRIYYEIHEKERKQRFTDFYRWKNLSEIRIENLYNKRMKDELPIIKGTREHANFEILEDGMQVNIRL